MSKKEILDLELCDIIAHLKNKELSSVEITKACLEQIEKENATIGAMLWENQEATLKMAQESDARRSKNATLGELDGVPIAIKDMILSTEFNSTAASKILENYVSPYDSTVVKNLRKNGVVLTGKCNQDEFAMGSSNECSAYKSCVNPWDTLRTPGGSSGGSAAALSANMCFASLGTDTGGSIRQPASFCGLFGLKPSYGRVSRYGIIAFASSLDQVGPFAKSTKGCAHVLNAIAGFDENDSTSARTAVPNYAKEITGDISQLRVGVPKEYFAEGLSDEVRDAVMNSVSVLKKNGAKIVEISLPQTKYAVATYYIIATAEASSNLSRYDGVRYGPRFDGHKDLLSMYEETRGHFFGEEVKRRILLGTYVLSAGYYDAYYLRAQKVRRLFAQDFEQAFKNVDVIISPTTPSTAFKIGEKISDPLSMYLNDIYTISANLAGICGISVPTHMSSDGLPIGTQLMANAFCEQDLFNASFALEQNLSIETTPKKYKK